MSSVIRSVSDRTTQLALYFLPPFFFFHFSYDQGDMEQALENYDICTEMLQSSSAIQAEAGAEQGDIVIRLPNLHNDSVVSLEEVSRCL